MRAAIQDYYPAAIATCYGCGPFNEHGLRLKSTESGDAGDAGDAGEAGDEVVARFKPRPHDMAMPGFVYGGLVASLVDCHGIATASAHAMRQAGLAVGEAASPLYVTAALRVEFLRPTPLGPELELRARVSDTGKRKIVVAVRVLAEGVETVRGEVVAVPAPDAMASGGA